MRQWGRWVIEGESLTFNAGAGELDPGYALETSAITDESQISEWQEHLSYKSWISPEDLAGFAEACRYVLDSRSLDEMEEDRSFRYTLSYLEALDADWKSFLESANPKDESAFQQYLEWHPSLLPGPHGTPWGRYHGPPLGVVFSQPELPGFRAKRPDFLVLERDSATTYAVLIEIEAPAKRWSTAAGVPTADLTQAIDQLRDWKVWFADPLNVLQFIKLYDLNDQIETSRLVQHYVLVYGRRHEATNMEAFARKRHDLAGPNEYFMTYDRLEPNGAGALTVKLDRSGPDTRLRAISVTPRFALNTHNAEWFLSLLEGREAIMTNPLMSDHQRTSLLKRERAARNYLRNLERRRERRSWWDLT
jgi:hypothetical protein